MADYGVAEELNVSAGERLQSRNCPNGELLGLDGAGDGEGGVLGAGGLEVNDDADVDAVEDGVEGLAGVLGVDPDGVEEGDLPGGGGALDEGGGGGGEEGADVGADG